MSDFKGLPEHEIMSKANDKSRAIWEFVDWMKENQSMVFTHAEMGGVLSEDGVEAALYQFLGVDKKKFYAEKELMYKQIKEVHLGKNRVRTRQARRT